MKLTLKHAIVVFGILPILAACGGGGGDTPSPVDPGPTLEERQADQRDAISSAIGTAQTAVAAVDNDSTDSEVSAADSAIAAARSAIAAAVDVPAAEKSANTGTVNALASRLTDAKSARQMAMDDARDAADAAMMKTAMKLYSGIGSAPLMSTGDGGRSAMYSGTNDADITVTMDDAAEGDGTDSTQVLKATKMMVAANHGWEGKQYMASGTGVDGTYEAVVYSNVGEPTQGPKFNSGTGEGDVGFATTDGVLTIAAGQNLAKRIASPSFDHSAGTKTFKLPYPNPTGESIVTIPGSYYGVSGTYSCTPGTAADGCVVTRAADGYTLDVATDTWTFKATNPSDRVTEMPDTNYASYGWWIHKAANDGAFTASAFVDEKGTVGPAENVGTLMGTATYSGGAAGKYALHSTTGGTNDAGHFIARAMLEANFNDDMITGTIDNFMGADGMSRNWSVELKKSAIGDTGLIRRSDDDNSDLAADDPGAMTAWTIDGTAAAASGQWSGSLKDNGDDGVPKVATGTFHSTYGRDGSMVGAFGATKDDD